MQTTETSIFNVNGDSLPGPFFIWTFEKRAPGKGMEFEFHLQSPCGSPSTQLWDFRQSTRSGNERECKKKHWKARANGNDFIIEVEIFFEDQLI